MFDKYYNPERNHSVSERNQKETIIITSYLSFIKVIKKVKPKGKFVTVQFKPKHTTQRS